MFDVWLDYVKGVAMVPNGGSWIKPNERLRPAERNRTVAAIS